MKTLKSVLVMSGVASAAVLAFAAPAVACPKDHSANSSYTGGHGNRHHNGDNGDNVGILNGNDFCSLVNIIGIVDC